MNRIYHTWNKWECFLNGFFETQAKDLTEEDCHRLYAELLMNIPKFKAVMSSIIKEWKNSCEHNLTNERMNRIAWMGQAALCFKYKIPAKYRGGYHLLTENQQKKADEAALEIINVWMLENGYSKLTMQQIQSKTEADLY